MTTSRDARQRERARVLAVLNSKGGAGKTTLATHLAHGLQQFGSQVLLVDADPQGSLRDWNETNAGSLIPVIGLDRETLPKDLGPVSGGFDYVVIDGAPQVARLSAAAVRAADMVLIPVQPSPYDIWAAGDLVEIIEARREVTGGGPQAAFVVSRAIRNTKLSGEVVAALDAYGLPVLRSRTTQRVAYPTSASKGSTVLADDPHGAAAQEIIAITNETLEVLNDTTDQKRTSRDGRQATGTGGSRA